MSRSSLYKMQVCLMGNKSRRFIYSLTHAFKSATRTTQSQCFDWSDWEMELLCLGNQFHINHFDLLLTVCSYLKQSGWNPIRVYLRVSHMEQRKTCFRVNMREIALHVQLSSQVFFPGCKCQAMQLSHKQTDWKVSCLGFNRRYSRFFFLGGGIRTEALVGFFNNFLTCWRSLKLFHFPIFPFLQITFSTLKKIEG